MNNEILLCYGYLDNKNMKKFKEVMKNKKIAISYRCDFSKDIWGITIKRLIIILKENSNKSILDYNKIDYKNVDLNDLWIIKLTSYGASMKDRISYLLTKDINIIYKDFWYEVKIQI